MPQYFSYKSTNAISKLALSISYENIERCVCAGSNFFKDIKKSASDIFALSLRLRRKDIRSFLLNILSKVTAARTPRSIFAIYRILPDKSNWFLWKEYTTRVGEIYLPNDALNKDRVTFNILPTLWEKKIKTQNMPF